jgi:pyruvate/2-oxoglutarate dehydrogenase complex dihydrolipoamide dehydrogenase (E3) component
MDNNFDIVVIGGGSGGLFAASAAVNQKAKVCLIDKKQLGGDCTWFGCMQSKTLLKSAMVANLIKKREHYGLFSKAEINLNTDRVMEHVRSVREEIGAHETPDVFEKRGIKVIIGVPKFTGSNTLTINGQQIKAKKFIISTGSHPMIPPIEGLQDIDYLTNETVFDLEVLPKSLIVLGGGPIGLELSQALSRLGVKVSVVEMIDRVLFREDEEVARVLEKKISDEGVKLFTGKRAIKFEKNDEQVVIHLEDNKGKKEKISAEKVLVAVGRAPNVEGLGLENCGVEYTNKGLKVNEYLQTTNENIFACGDIASPYQFSHVAAYTAYICVRNSLFKKLAWSKVNYINVGWATFTDPELARVGLTEDEARKKFKDVRVYKTDYSSSDRSTTDLVKDGMIKVITDKKGLVLGAHIVGAQAGEIIQGLLISKSLSIPLSKLAPILYIYPTLSELVKKTAAKPLVESLSNPFLKSIINIMRS